MKILFQGDSITDAARAYDNDANVDRGYALLIKRELDLKYLSELKEVQNSKVEEMCEKLIVTV